MGVLREGLEGVEDYLAFVERLLRLGRREEALRYAEEAVAWFGRDPRLLPLLDLLVAHRGGVGDHRARFRLRPNPRTTWPSRPSWAGASPRSGPASCARCKTPPSSPASTSWRRTGRPWTASSSGLPRRPTPPSPRSWRRGFPRRRPGFTWRRPRPGWRRGAGGLPGGGGASWAACPPGPQEGPGGRLGPGSGLSPKAGPAGGARPLLGSPHEPHP